MLAGRSDWSVQFSRKANLQHVLLDIYKKKDFKKIIVLLVKKFYLKSCNGKSRNFFFFLNNYRLNRLYTQ